MQIKVDKVPANCLSCPFLKQTTARMNYCQAQAIINNNVVKSKSTYDLKIYCPLETIDKPNKDIALNCLEQVKSRLDECKHKCLDSCYVKNCIVNEVIKELKEKNYE